MVVRRIARPAARQRQHLAEDETCLRWRIGAIEDRTHDSQAPAADLAFAAPFVRSVARSEPARRKARRVIAGVDRELGVGSARQLQWRAGGRVQAGRRLVEQRGALHLERDVAQPAGCAAGHQQPRGLARGGRRMTLAGRELQDAHGNAAVVAGGARGRDRGVARPESRAMFSDEGAHALRSLVLRRVSRPRWHATAPWPP